MSVSAAVRPLAAQDLDRPIKAVLPELARGASALGRLDVATPRDALFYLPFRYDDFSELRPLRDLVADEKQSARVRVTDVKIEKGFGRRPQRVIAQLADDTGTAEAIWFGRRFVENRLRPGAELLVSGKVQLRGWRPQFVSPEFSAADHESLHTGRVVPVYRLSSGVTQKRVRELLARVLERALPALDDPLTDGERAGLPGLADALHTAHFPEEAADVPAALDRLAFDELLALQLTLAQAREARAALTRRPDRGRARRAGAPGGGAALQPDRRPARGGGRGGGRPGRRSADAPAAAGRRRQRQDGGRGGGAGRHRARRLAGGADGTDRDPGAAASPRPGAAAGGAGRPRRVPVRLADARRASARSMPPSPRARPRS